MPFKKLFHVSNAYFFAVELFKGLSQFNYSHTMDSNPKGLASMKKFILKNCSIVRGQMPRSLQLIEYYYGVSHTHTLIFQLYELFPRRAQKKLYEKIKDFLT